jgi:hypothetical protein
MSPDLFLPILVAIVFLRSGLAGLAYHAWDPGPEGGSETRDLTNRLTGLVATLSVLVLGLLIASTMLAQVNRAGVAGLAVGAVAVVSAIFLVVELSAPYSGLLKLSPAPVIQTLEALDR